MPSEFPAQSPPVIAPAAAPLSTRRTSGRSPRLPALRMVGFLSALLLLGAVAAFVFFALPDRVAPRIVSGSPPAPSVPAPETAGGVAPFEAQAAAEARVRAQRELASFAAAELALDALHVEAWGAAELDAARRRAEQADRLFLAADYAAAFAEYAGAVADIEALVAKGASRFEDAVAEGGRALQRHDAAAAAAAFERAAAMRPDDAAVQRGLARAAKLPEAVRLLRETRRALLRGSPDAAARHVAALRGLDAETAGLPQLAARVAAAQAAERRDAQLSRAFAALQSGDHAAAIAAFDGVLAAHPDDAAALAGRRQAAQIALLARIGQLRSAALAAERAEDWQGAIDSYAQALALDGSLQFARDGSDRARRRAALAADAQRILSDPGQLSGDREFAAARALLARMEAEADAGARFAARAAALRTALARSETPVPVVFTSDNATQVAIRAVGALGAFERREQALRPGRYVVVGSRAGYRDVRLDVDVSSGMAPVDVRCVEPVPRARRVSASANPRRP